MFYLFLVGYCFFMICHGFGRVLWFRGIFLCIYCQTCIICVSHVFCFLWYKFVHRLLWIYLWVSHVHLSVVLQHIGSKFFKLNTLVRYCIHAFKFYVHVTQISHLLCFASLLLSPCIITSNLVGSLSLKIISSDHFVGGILTPLCIRLLVLSCFIIARFGKV